MTATLIDPTAANDQSEARIHRRLVKVSDLVMYVFFKTSSGAAASDCCYRKTTDGGVTWGAEVDIGATGAFSSSLLDIYYERWNGDANDNIVHLFRIQAVGGNYGGYYRQLNLDSDVLSAEQYVFTLGIPGNAPGGICLAPSGRIYICGHGLTGGGKMYYSDNDGSTWTRAASTFTEIANQDELHMRPDYSAANTASVLAIFHDWDVDELTVKQFNATGEAITETAIGSGFEQSANFGQIASAMSCTTHHIRVAAIDQPTGSQELFTYDVYGATVTTTTKVLTGVTFIRAVGVTVTASDNTFVFYGRDPDALSFSSSEVYYKTSTDAMTTWGAQAQYGSRTGSAQDIITAPCIGGSTVGAVWRDGVELYIETPLIPQPEASIGITITLSGTLTGVTVAQPPIVIKCRALAVPNVITATLGTR